MKKVLSLVLTGVLALTLAGCVQIEDPKEEVDCDLYPTHVDCIVVDPNDPDVVVICTTQGEWDRDYRSEIFKSTLLSETFSPQLIFFHIA